LDGKYESFEDVPAEFEDPLTRNSVRADLAIVGHTADGERRGIVLEVQLDVDLSKEWTMELYRAGLRRLRRCPAWAVLFSPDENVRTVMCERMFVEEPETRPFVVTPEMIPIVQDLQTALDNYAWAVLAAAVHMTGPYAVTGATVAIRALLRIAPEHYEKYIQLISASVGEEIMQQVREQLPPEGQIELTDFERRGSTYVRAHREGLREGLEQGREQGREQGLEQGLARGLQAALLTVLEVRGLALDDRMQERIAACSDIDQLRELIARAKTITTSEELFPSS
jgi:hypothetical protein